MTINTQRIETMLAERGLTKAAYAASCGISRQNVSTIIRRGTAEPTKTHGSNRVLTLVGQTVPYLKQLRAGQMKSGLLTDKVVAWPDGRAMRPDGVTRMFNTLLRKSGIEKARFHDLRHANVKPKTKLFLVQNNGQ